MLVYLTGATGYVGSYVLRELVARGHRARCLVRDPSRRLAEEGDAVERVAGDVTDRESVERTIGGCDAVIHLVGIIEEKPARGVTFDAVHHQGARHVMDAARDAGVGRFALMSANGARPDGVSAYQVSKWKAERHLEASGFERWTIFRPSILFGDPGPDNVDFATRLARDLVGPFPVLPVFGSGAYRIQPIEVEAVAEAFARALTMDAANGRRYCVAGRQAFAYADVLDVIAQGMGRRPKRKIRVPVSLVRPVVRTAGRAGLIPISPDQFDMLLDGNTCDPSTFYRDFEIDSAPFSPENLRYLAHRV